MKQATLKLTAVLAVALGLAVLTLYATQVDAYNQQPQHRDGDEGDRTEISISNSAELKIEAEVKAESGDAEAEGGDGEEGGNGGDTGAYGTGGAGGNGGAGGAGGYALSGDAQVIGSQYVDVNSTRVYVEGCGCEEETPLSPSFFMMSSRDDDEGDRLEISVRNRLMAEIELEVEAESGDVDADGGDGDEGGNGGDVEQNRRSHNPWMMWYLWNTGTGGAGGNGARGGDGGTAISGIALADGLSEVLLNETVVRVPRGASEEEAEE